MALPLRASCPSLWSKSEPSFLLLISRQPEFFIRYSTPKAIFCKVTQVLIPTQTWQTSSQSALPSSNAVTLTATTRMDYNKAIDKFVAKQTALQPIKPIATQ